MPEIITNDGTLEKAHVTVKTSGWVKAYDDLSRDGTKKVYEGLRHIPAQRIKTIHGEVTYESPHGRV
jgi:hypothetical protein